MTIEHSAARARKAAYEISVVSYQGKPPPTSISAVFGNDGGTIGRGTNNTLVLPDPNRFVSRVQTRIFSDGGAIKIANASTANPLLLNDRELDSGAEEPLRDGDELRIGLYVLKVRKIEALGTAAPTSDAPTGSVDSSPRPVAARSAVEAAGPRKAGKASTAPLTAAEGATGGSMSRSTPPPASQSTPPPASQSTPPPASQGGSTPPSMPSHASGGLLPTPSTLRPTLGTTLPAPADPAPRTAPSAAAFVRGNGGASSLGPVDPLQLEFGQSGDDPFADLMQSASSPPTQTAGDPVPQDAARISQPSPATGPVEASKEASWPSFDLHKPREERAVDSASSPTEVPEHVWDDLAQLAPTSSPPTPAVTPLPPNFDAFAQPSHSARNAEDPLAEFAHNAVALESLDKLDTPIDTLFADSPLRSRASEDVIPDPHAQAPDPLGGRDSLDPIAIFDEAAGKRESLNDAFNRSERDDVPEMEAFFRPPQPTLEAKATPQPNVPNLPDPSHLGDDDGRRTSVSGDPLSPSRNDASREQPRETSSDPPGGIETSHAANMLQDAARVTESGPGTYDELLHEFLHGAGIPHATMQDSLTPALMRHIGRMLAIAVQGTIELIAARALVKREVKADVTIIASTRNNPLKFLPDAESALLQMFGARIPGFMEPVEAMEDAYRDLRAHEVGVIAGMHAALAEVLKRFEPAELERRLKPAGLLEGLLPNSRQARLWQTFAEMYVDISREAQDDFQSLFGKAFLHAYENEVSRLKGQ